MGIFIPSKYIKKHTKGNESLIIDTYMDVEPTSSRDIIGVDGCEFAYDYTNQENIRRLQCDLYDAYLDMKDNEICDECQLLTPLTYELCHEQTQNLNGACLNKLLKELSQKL